MMMMAGCFCPGDPEELPWIKLEPTVPIVTTANYQGSGNSLRGNCLCALIPA